MRALVVLVLVSTAAPTLLAQPVLPTWKLDAAPSLSIGGEGPAEFFRISGVVRLSTGHIAVVNAGTNEVRVFDATGSHVSTFGRTGSGPGEFRGPGRVWRAGDTLMIDDFQLLRFTALLGGPEVTLLRVVPITARSNTNRYTIEGRSPDGRWLVLATESFQQEGPDAIRRLKALVGLIPADGGGKVDSVAQILSGAYSVWNPSGDFRKGGFIGTVPFTPWAYTASTSTHIWFGDGATDSLVAIRGTDRRAIRLPFRRREVTARDKEIFRARVHARTTDPRVRAVTDQILESKYVPKYFPFYEAMIPGSDNELWVQEYAGVNSAATRYLIIGSDLKPRAWVPVPAGFRVKDAGRDYVAGVHFDEDDVETVRVYRLTR